MQLSELDKEILQILKEIFNVKDTLSNVRAIFIPTYNKKTKKLYDPGEIFDKLFITMLLVMCVSLLTMHVFGPAEKPQPLFTNITSFIFALFYSFLSISINIKLNIHSIFVYILELIPLITTIILIN